MKRLLSFILMMGFFSGITVGEISLDSEQLNLEMRMQARVEEALSKILTRDQFVVVIRVEPIPNITREKVDGAADGESYFLPGVPAIRSYNSNAEAINNLNKTLSPDKEVFHKFIRRITALLVLDQDLPEETVSRVRELTRQLLSLDPARGDTLEIQRSAFQKPNENPIRQDGITKFQENLKQYWFIILLVLFLFCVGVFVLFVFGPLRGFLDRLVQILPTLKPIDSRGGNENALLSTLLASQAMNFNNQNAPMLGMGGPSFSGSLQVENPNKKATPFSFIREDHLSNLAILLTRETPEKAATVLGYLPTDWIIRVLDKMDSALQTEITNHLATTRQLLPEQVEDIEQDLKRRLDYLIGGPDRIISVYESLDPEAQKRMLDNLSLARPEVAEELRKRTFMFEDLDRLESPALKTILREVDLQTLVVSMRGTDDQFRERILLHLPEGKAQIVKEEIEMSDDSVGKPTLEAQRKISLIVRRLEREGQIHVARSGEEAPVARYPDNLRSNLKLPPGLRMKAAEKATAQEGEIVEKSAGIQERIKRFMNRRSTDRERFPADGTIGVPDKESEE